MNNKSQKPKYNVGLMIHGDNDKFDIWTLEFQKKDLLKDKTIKEKLDEELALYRNKYDFEPTMIFITPSYAKEEIDPDTWPFINGDSNIYENFSDLSDAYMRSADTLFEAMKRKYKEKAENYPSIDMDSVGKYEGAVVIYLLHHALELYIKSLLIACDEEVPATHRATELFSKIEPYLSDQSETDAYYIFKSAWDEFYKYHDNSMMYKYPTDKDGKIIYNEDQKIDIARQMALAHYLRDHLLRISHTWG